MSHATSIFNKNIYVHTYCDVTPQTCPISTNFLNISFYTFIAFYPEQLCSIEIAVLGTCEFI